MSTCQRFTICRDGLRQPGTAHCCWARRARREGVPPVHVHARHGRRLDHPQTIGLIRSMFAGSELAKAMSTIGPVMGLSVIFGPILGAVLTHADLFGSSWRSAFLVNVPLAAPWRAAVLMGSGRPPAC
ncbi:hypothetical protein [Nonomuraea sp. NPDC003709]|uniref:hypothetical protein n=1 Tax=Nonomuraea sp. NPDC003709 TaxID=3154450 RepID=UPI0033BC3122